MLASRADAAGDSAKGERECRWGDEFVPTPVHDRRRLRPGFAIAGPALIEDVDTVVAVSPGWVYEMDDRMAGHMRRA
jgi:N-methylhydantoinase A/oxoprolinase/acetone carboxylase beta subunit